MRKSTTAGIITATLVFIVLFGIVLITSEGWYKTKVTVQEPVYEYVPASQFKIIGCWLAAIGVLLLIGVSWGIIIVFSGLEKEEG